ncbi:xyloglucan galactosyltransferase XLT2 [Cryptomeria japonica]|uniref:xyloglucan galactosyltransferase XLT2 n=1 Tax=Cryptomeria japonica TaxID=3369 RepID=UPI0027DAA112|nr:xyloglucan galactosyltransferase XLT2 [Cryptomeria japonica]
MVLMKYGMGHKKKGVVDIDSENKVGWGRTLNMGSPLRRYMLAAVLALQIIILVIVRGLPVPFPWLPPCPVPVADVSATVGAAALNVTASWDDDSETSNDSKDDVAVSGDFVTESVASDVSNAENASCELGLVYVYNLPPVFNTDLLKNCSTLSPWNSFCPAIVNFGYGDVIRRPKLQAEERGTWYKTDQFTGEIIFHKKLMEHPCVTDKPHLARAFYVPFYAGLAVGRYLWREYPAEVRDRDGKMVLEWLQEQEYWKRNSGWDHFMVVGRITWDFRRSKDEDWGSSFMYMPGIKNVTRLLIERNPWDDKEMGVPYPTAFHPRSAQDVLRWQDHLRNVERTKLFSFAGASRKYIPNDFRGILLDQCMRSMNCRSLDCSGTRCVNDTMAAVHLFLDSTFCLQPRGDSFTRKSIFDCLIAGSIPVFFWHRSAYWQYEWHLPSNYSSYSVFISKHDIRNGTQIEEVLKRIPAAEVQRLRETVISSIPRYVYSAPGHRLKGMKDAVDTAIDGFLNTVKSSSLAHI